MTKVEATWRRLLAVVVALAMPAVACARPLPGTSGRTLVVGGVTRTYLLHTGGAAKPGRALVLVLHGLGGSGAAIERRTRATFDKLADRDGAVVVYPDALGDPHRWSDGWNAASATIPPDDLGFLSALIDALAAELGVDRKRVFAAGLSNGAAMVYRLACERPELVAAVAPVSGGMAPEVARACPHGTTPVSIIRMHGTDDPIVAFGPSIHDVETWVRRDACPARPISSRLPDADPGDGTQTRVEVFEPCAAGTAVAFYTIEGGGHAWPGGEPKPGFARSGNTPRDFDAGAVIWDFFQKHPRR